MRVAFPFEPGDLVDSHAFSPPLFSRSERFEGGLLPVEIEIFVKAIKQEI